MRSSPSRWLAALLVLSAALAACGKPPDTSTTWVYDEATTMKNTGTEQQAAAKRHLAGYGLTLVIDQGSFVMSVVGGPAPGEYRGSVKATNDGIRISVKTRDGKPVDPATAELNLRQPERRRMEWNVGGITAQLIMK